MRAIRVHVVGEERRLVMEEAPTPQPAPDQVLVWAEAIGINGADLRRRPTADQGPIIIGYDVAGVVDAVGADVTGIRAGDRVMALVQSGYAEYVPAQAVLAYPIPAGMDAGDAASIPCVFLTAWYGLTAHAKVQPGETVLVHSAGSGVGMAAIQIARALGTRVLTSAGSDEKLRRGMDLGAEAGVNYSTQSLTDELLRLTGGKGVDAVIDPVSGEIFNATLPALAQGGRVVTIGASAGARPDVDAATLSAKGQVVDRMGVFGDASADTEKKGYAQLARWFEDGTIRTVVHQRFPWTSYDEALRLLGSRQVFGKLVLVVDGAT